MNQVGHAAVFLDCFLTLALLCFILHTKLYLTHARSYGVLLWDRFQWRLGGTWHSLTGTSSHVASRVGEGNKQWIREAYDDVTLTCLHNGGREIITVGSRPVVIRTEGRIECTHFILFTRRFYHYTHTIYTNFANEGRIA